MRAAAIVAVLALAPLAAPATAAVDEAFLALIPHLDAVPLHLGGVPVPLTFSTPLYARVYVVYAHVRPFEPDVPDEIRRDGWWFGLADENSRGAHLDFVTLGDAPGSYADLAGGAPIDFYIPVGRISNPDMFSAGILWADPQVGGLRDSLRTGKDPASPFYLAQISEVGQYTAYDIKLAVEFSKSPIGAPEPATAAVVLGAAIAVLMRRRRWARGA